MANEGIMSLPAMGGMQGEQAPQSQAPTVTSADSYDAAQTALGMVNPADQAAAKEAVRQAIGDLQLTPEQIDLLIQVFEYVSQNPGDYKNLLQQLIEAGAADPGDFPEEYDPQFIGMVLMVLHEMQQMRGRGAMEPMDMSPIVEGLQPAQMAEGGLADVASYLASQGRGGDSMLAHITPEEAEMLKRRGGAGTINPITGLPEFKGNPLKKVVNAVKGVVKKVVGVVKKALQSPVGRILGTIALATVLGPAGLGLQLGSTAAASAAINAGLASAGTTLLGGGSLKEALVSGAMGYVGGGGTIMGANPVSAVGSYLPGAAGGALNTGLATGVIGAGVGKLAGMSTADALKMGLSSGVTAGALKALQPGAPAAETPGQTPGQTPGGAPATQQGIGQLPASADVAGVGAPGQIGTAQDILASTSPGAPGGTMPADYQAEFYRSIGIRPETMSPTSVGPSPTNIQIERSALGMTGPIDTARQFVQEPLNVAKDIYNTQLSPSRPGLPADAGVFQKYGPLALAGTGVMAATGGMKGEPANPNPAFNRNYTGLDYMRDNPDMFRGGLDFSYVRPETPANPVVQTDFSRITPGTGIAQPGVIMPTGATMSPGGIAQPYNVAGLYGVPLIYPVNRAKGGEMTMTEFPRKTGPINGPGTGTSDSIPAMLSDGEFVFTAKAVRNAGGGSRRKGAARMYKLMKKLEGGPVKG